MAVKEETKLCEYLPEYLQEYREIKETLEAENPEFQLIWNASDKVLSNQYIQTADEYGISRFERLLGILPSVQDNLESRRAKVQARWFNTLPYTLRALIGKLKALSGDKGFTLTKYYEIYRLDIETDLELYGQVEELERIVEELLPCNIWTRLSNTIPCNSECRLFFGGGLAVSGTLFVTNDEQRTYDIKMPVLNGGKGFDMLLIKISDKG